MTLEDWGMISVICGALIALGTVLGWLYRKVVRPMWGRTARALRRINRGADDLLGKPAEYDYDGNLLSPEVTSLRSEIQSLKTVVQDMGTELTLMRVDFDTHVQWHPAPSGRPAMGQLPRRKENGKE